MSNRKCNFDRFFIAKIPNASIDAKLVSHLYLTRVFFNRCPSCIPYCFGVETSSHFKLLLCICIHWHCTVANAHWPWRFAQKDERLIRKLKKYIYTYTNTLTHSLTRYISMHIICRKFSLQSSHFNGTFQCHIINKCCGEKCTDCIYHYK